MDVDMSRFRDSLGSLIKKAPPLSIPVEMKSFNFFQMRRVGGVFRTTADMGKPHRPARGNVPKKFRGLDGLYTVTGWRCGSSVAAVGVDGDLSATAAKAAIARL